MNNHHAATYYTRNEKPQAINEKTVLAAIASRNHNATDASIAWDLNLADSPANIKAIRKVTTALRRSRQIKTYFDRTMTSYYDVR